MKTYTAKPGEIQREWFLVDAEGQTLGRLATRIADMLRGKGKPAYTPHVDTGDFVIVVNAEKIAVTGSKLDTKIYYRHSGYPGGIKQRTLREQLERRPTEVIRKAVKGMLPKNKLASAQLTKLKVYAGPGSPARGPGAQGAGALVSEIAQYLGTGKRKTSVARVILRPGDGKTWINGRTLDEYFPRAVHRKMVLAPLEVAEAATDVRPPRPRRRRWPVGSGRRDQARHRPRARRGRPGDARAAQAPGLPDARCSHRGAQEGRPAQGPQGSPVLKR